MIHINNNLNYSCSTININVNSNTSCRGCYKNISSDDPASIYQTQKIIQKVVRINSSLYAMNLAGLNVYQEPANTYQIVEQSGTSYVVPPKLNWNQMSDRARPANQIVKTGSGSTYGSNSLKRTKVRDRPGAMSPGGIGVDIKHNSYERYLNRIKGKGLLKQGKKEIEGNMTGGKNNRMGIISGCECDKNKINPYANNISDFNNVMYNINYIFKAGQTILVRKNKYENKWYKGKIIDIIESVYLIDFNNGIIEQIDVTKIPVIPYFKKDASDCLIDESTTFEELLSGNEVCEKEQLLEQGIFI